MSAYVRLCRIWKRKTILGVPLFAYVPFEKEIVVSKFLCLLMSTYVCLCRIWKRKAIFESFCPLMSDLKKQKPILEVFMSAYVFLCPLMSAYVGFEKEKLFSSLSVWLCPIWKSKNLFWKSLCLLMSAYVRLCLLMSDLRKKNYFRVLLSAYVRFKKEIVFSKSLCLLMSAYVCLLPIWKWKKFF